MDISQLRAFMETCRTGSFTRAAEHLYISQPALHRKVRQLEGDLGVTLLAVRNRQVVPTELGESVLAAAERIFAEIHSLETRVAAATQSIRVGAVSLIGAMVLPDTIEAFQERNPGRQVTLRSMEADQLTDALFAGNLDIGLTYLHYVTADLQHEGLWTHETVCAASNAHPLADGKHHDARELLAYPIALTFPGMGLRTKVEAWFQDEIELTDVPVSFEASTGALLAQYVAASGKHLTFLPLPSLSQFNLQQVMTNPIGYQTHVVACRLLNAPPRKDVDEFLQLLRDISREKFGCPT